MWGLTFVRLSNHIQSQKFEKISQSNFLKLLLFYKQMKGKNCDAVYTTYITYIRRLVYIFIAR